MLVTTQWPLKRAAELTSLVWYCVLWRPESLMDLSALWSYCLIEFWFHWCLYASPVFIPIDARYIAVKYSTLLHNNFECKTSATCPHGRAMVVFVSYLEKSDRDIYGVHCITVVCGTDYFYFIRKHFWFHCTHMEHAPMLKWRVSNQIWNMNVVLQ